METDLIDNEINAIELISAPESFPTLKEMVNDINSNNLNPFKISSELIESFFQVFFGKLYSFSKEKSSTIFSNYKVKKQKILNDTDKTFLDNYINSFWRNQIFIANIIKNSTGSNTLNRHLVVLQPNLKNIQEDSLWYFANKKIEESLKNQNLPENISILDLRYFALKDKLQRISLYDSIILNPLKINQKVLLNLNYFDTVHLTDIGVKRFGTLILEKYKDKKSKKF